MFVIHGQYHFYPKRTAFRNDYCLGCDAPRRCLQIRTFDVLHMFWVPLLPLGLWRRWHCVTCGRSPAFNPRSRRKFLITISLLGAFSAGIFWLMPVDAEQSDLWWFFRIGGLLVSVVSFLAWAWLPQGPSSRERLARVPPASDTECPCCKSPLDWSSWQCPRCGIARK
jgi:hypothetical protein